MFKCFETDMWEIPVRQNYETVCVFEIPVRKISVFPYSGPRPPRRPRGQRRLVPAQNRRDAHLFGHLRVRLPGERHVQGGSLLRVVHAETPVADGPCAGESAAIRAGVPYLARSPRWRARAERFQLRVRARKRRLLSMPRGAAHRRSRR